MVTTLEESDRERWSELWRGYLAFYETELPAVVYETTWARILSLDGPIRALGVRNPDGELVGITHYFFHPHAWATNEACYLQDLFVDAAERGRGYARALIAGVADAARARNAIRVYWLTQETNVTARLLYDKVAHYTGFVRYDLAL